MLELPFYKNQELAKELGVTPTTIGRYIKDSENKLNELELVKVKGGNRIKKTELNFKTLKEIVGKSDNFKNQPRYKVIEPTADLFDDFNQDQIDEMCIDLKNNKIIKHKYNYIGDGADKYFYVWQNDRVNEVNDLTYCLNSQVPFLKGYADSNNLVYNIFEIGAGQMAPSLQFVKEVFVNGLLNKYTVLDFSPSMMAKTKQIFSENFPTKFFDSKIIDVENNSLREVISDATFTNPPFDKKVVNIILLAGRTMTCFNHYDEIFRNFSDALYTGDLIIFDRSVTSFKEMNKQVLQKSHIFYNFITGAAQKLGLNDENSITYLDYEESNNSLKMYMEIKMNLHLLLPAYNFSLYLNKGDIIDITTGWIINLTEIDKVCLTENLRVLNIASSASTRFMNVMLQKN